MARGVLIIEQPSSSLHRQWGSTEFYPPWAVARQISWDRFTWEHLHASRESLVIANAVPATESATKFFRWLRENPVLVPTLAILPENDDELLRAAAEVVDDFLLSPFRADELRGRVTRLLGANGPSLEDIQASLAGEIGLRQLLGQDQSFQKVISEVAMFGASDAPVLLTGETGTGKELCARVMHLLSKRRHGPFIPVDCGALPDHLFENEVFGHTRGAFTDAQHDQKGLVALAERGTLFLDEIDSLSHSAQSKVLRLLQEHTYRPLGSDTFRRADLRIAAATNRDLEELVVQKQFRSDLFFRINVLRVRLPALRERRADIPLLSRHFIEEICRSAGIPRKVLSAAALHRLEQRPWPGNVRELYNTVQRAVLCSSGQQIPAAMIEADAAADGEWVCQQGFRSAKLSAIESFERQYVQQMLEKHAGNVTRAAREAGKDRRAFGRLAKKYGIHVA